VACDSLYQDPYDLVDEVTFARSDDPTNDWHALANESLKFVDEPYLCLLMPGIRMEQDFASESIGWLEQETSLAAVAPRIHGVQSRPISAAAMSRRGRRVLLTTEQVNSPRTTAIELGPTCLAGFYRTESLRQVGGWNDRIHAEIADIELSSRLENVGFECEFAGTSVDFGFDGPVVAADGQGTAFQLGRDTERLFRTMTARSGLFSIRPISLAFESIGKLGSGAMAHAMGRLAGAFGDLPQPEPRERTKPLHRQAA